jgi:hypothetical protein
MRTSYKFLFILTLTAIIGLGSCKRYSELLENPNNPSPSAADVDLYLNAVQLSFSNVFNGANGFGMSLTRMQVFYGPTYASGYSPNSTDGLWTDAYTGVIKQTDAMIPVARAQGKYVHAAIAEILKAYTLFTMVDMLGDVPSTEADKGVEQTNPAADKGSAVYATAIALLDTAIADLAKTPSSYPLSDLFFTSSGSSEAANWRKTAKTLKFRAYMNTRLVDNSAASKISTLITDGDLITTDANEWTFRYGTRQSTPNNRHPNYNNNYVASGGAGDYIGTYYLYAIVAEKAVPDPRRRYYFYRQTLSTPGNAQQQPCAYQAKPAHYSSSTPYCYFITAPGYWGRDHADASGISPDGNLRTTWGAYPAGGKYDNSDGAATTLNTGGQGSGILPLWMSFFYDFERAEAALTLGVSGDPRAFLESGIRKSVARVMAFPGQIGVSPAPSVGIPTQTNIDNYVNSVLSDYDATTTNDQKLDVILKEYYIALWGNGLDAYNMYRRTCRPKNLQPALQASPGAFIRTMLYPSVYVNLNSNATQKPDVTVKTFWDTNGSCTY